jgi:hypothetical protein
VLRRAGQREESRAGTAGGRHRTLPASEPHRSERSDRRRGLARRRGSLDGVDHPLALVEWHDAWFDHDQRTIEDRRPDYLVRTVGFLIDEGPRIVSVAQELLPDGEGFRAVTHIPVAVIERIVWIGPRT